MFPFYLSVYKKGAKPILAYQDREIIMDIIFRQNGIPNNYIQYTFPNEYNIQDDEKDGKTKMYLSAEVEHYKHVELKCEESSTNNEIILYTALSLNETSNENQTTSNEITTDKAETKTDIPAENTNKAETKTDKPKLRLIFLLKILIKPKLRLIFLLKILIKPKLRQIILMLMRIHMLIHM